MSGISHLEGRQAAKRLLAALLLVLCSFCLPADAGARETVLEPVAPWHVDWTRKTCLMRRGFGSADDLVMIQFERFEPADIFHLIVTGSPFRFVDQGHKFTVQYGSGDRQDVPYVMKGTNAANDTALFISGSRLLPLGEGWKPGDPMTPVNPADEAAVDSVTLRWAGNTVTLKTGPLDKAFAALRTCTEDLVKTWGLDPAEQMNLQRRPQPSNYPGKWLTPSDYPPSALRKGEQALLTFRLSIDDKGRPTDCDILRSYADAKFNDVLCKLLIQRARFKPAHDSSGNPIASYYVNQARFVIPY